MQEISRKLRGGPSQILNKHMINVVPNIAPSGIVGGHGISLVVVAVDGILLVVVSNVTCIFLILLVQHTNLVTIECLKNVLATTGMFLGRFSILYISFFSGLAVKRTATKFLKKHLQKVLFLS